MYKLPVAIVMLFCGIFYSASQNNNSNVHISFRDIPEYSASQINLYLLSNKMGTQTLIDSVVIKNNNSAQMYIPGNADPGLYSVMIYANVNGRNIKSNLNFLFDNEDVNFNTCIDSPMDSMHVSGSPVNSYYFDFMQKKKHFMDYYKTILKLKQMTLPDDTFYGELNKKGNNILEEQRELYKKIRTNHSDDIASEYCRWYLLSEVYVNEMSNVEQLRKTFLDRFNFSDPLIENSDLIDRITSTYMFLFKDESLTAEQQEQKLIDAIDVMMVYYSVDDEIVKYVATRLIKEFKGLAMENAVIHIADNYLNSNACLSDRAEENLLDEVSRLKHLQAGEKAPDFKIEMNGLHNFYDIKSDTLIVLFWATWCPHCKNIVPEMYDMLEKHSQTKVVAIALDDEAEAWDNAIKKYPQWIHLDAEKMWDDELAVNYAIYATPTIYILNSDFTIIDKVKNMDELKLLFNEKN